MTLRNSWKHRHFEPNVFALLANPYYLARSALYKAIVVHSSKLTGRVLDVGCGTKPYRSLFTSCSSYEGLDIDQPRNRERAIADHFYDGETFPFPDESFDGIICSQVLEHVFNPQVFLAEMGRILRPGGRLLLTVPFCWDEHEQPWDCCRYTSYGVADLVRRSGFQVLVQEKLVVGYAVLIQLAVARMQKGWNGQLQSRNLPGFKKFWSLFQVINAPLNLLGALIQMFPRSNSDLYLDNFLLLEKRLSHDA